MARTGTHDPMPSETVKVPTSCQSQMGPAPGTVQVRTLQQLYLAVASDGRAHCRRRGRALAGIDAAGTRNVASWNSAPAPGSGRGRGSR